MRELERAGVPFFEEFFWGIGVLDILEARLLKLLVPLALQLLERRRLVVAQAATPV